MTTWRENLILTATGKKNADLVIKNGRIVNVCTKEIYLADIVISDERIVLVGKPDQVNVDATQVIDANGMYLIPGLIDSHIHTESSGVTLTQMARLLLPRGVTTLMYAHEIANVLGLEGMNLVRRESKQIPLKIFIQTPTSVPWAAGLESPATCLDVDDIEIMLSWSESVSLGESDYFDVLNLNPEILKKIEAARKLGKPVNGHVAMLSGNELCAVAGAAFDDDHENYSSEEVLEKLRLGMKVILREANLPWIASAVTDHQIDTRNIMLCIDDKLANVIRSEGGVDHTVRLAIKHGIDPITVIQMATINAATHFRKDNEIGSITPGKIADILITSSLEELRPSYVIANGELIAHDGKLLRDLVPFPYPAWSKNTIHLPRKLIAEDFLIRAGVESGKVEARILELSSGGWVKNWSSAILSVSSGLVQITNNIALNRIAVIERHGGDGNIALGLISGIGLQKGCVASSLAHDCHNITVVGSNPEDMALCVNTLAELGGGFVAVDQGKVLATVQFEIAGLISQAPYEQVADQLDEFEKVIREQLGFSPEMVFVVFNFIALQSSPFIAAITDRGLIDTYSLSIVPLIMNVFTE